ncbi:hypothetical protein ACFXO9_30670 [Nocardia tengchongensis]|uniref:hypothetical protein n=1 Tax=Nocardia tengchongensis TaxID=2055889 RepID=UPI00368B1838
MERFDQDLAWHRDDRWFFAAGACHILAYAVLERYGGGFSAAGLWPRAAADPSHVYARNGVWAFDHSGWTPVTELLKASRTAEPDADYCSRPIAMDLDEFCARHWHRSRAEFPYDPWPRTHAYITQFDRTAPEPFR